jgi:hypothetical protein
VASQRDPVATKLTAAILAVDAAVLLGLFLSISITTDPVADPQHPSARADGTPNGIENAFWLLLIPIGLAIAFMVYLGVREVVGLRKERHEFEHRPVAEQHRLRAAGSALHGLSVGAPPVADRIAGRRTGSRASP